MDYYNLFYLLNELFSATCYELHVVLFASVYARGFILMLRLVRCQLLLVPTPPIWHTLVAWRLLRLISQQKVIRVTPPAFLLDCLSLFIVP
jgi:hypothetical protein